MAKQLNILVHIPSISKNSGGIYQYTIGLLQCMTQCNHMFYVYNHNINEHLKQLCFSYKNVIIIDSTELKNTAYENFLLKIRKLLYPFVLSILKRNVLYKDYVLERIVKQNNIDIFHCPYQELVEYKNIPSITTLHDVQELHFPEFFSSADRAWRATNYKKIIDNAQAVIVSYEHIKKDIVKYFSKHENSLYVCLLNMSNLWFKEYLKAREENKYQHKKVSKFNSFILLPSVIWPHKNHIAVIKAIAKIANEKGEVINLVCTGNTNTPYFIQLQEAIKEFKLENNIEFLGIVSEEDLFHLYSTCKAVVVPTLYEAGSFPLMESIFIEVPVVCSNVTSLPETIGNSNYTFNPQDINEIATKIYSIVNDKEYIENCKQLLKQQQQRLIHTGIVEQLEKIYLNLKK
jgi:glycosyltransferase involved in cell wall biosynthesis